MCSSPKPRWRWIEFSLRGPRRAARCSGARTRSTWRSSTRGPPRRARSSSRSRASSRRSATFASSATARCVTLLTPPSPIRRERGLEDLLPARVVGACCWPERCMTCGGACVLYICTPSVAERYDVIVVAAISPASRPHGSARCGAGARCCSRPATGWRPHVECRLERLPGRVRRRWVHWHQPHTFSELTRARLSVSVSDDAGRAHWHVGAERRTGTIEQRDAIARRGWDRFVEGVREALPQPHAPLTALPELARFDRMSMAERLAELDLDGEDARRAGRRARVGRPRAALRRRRRRDSALARAVWLRPRAHPVHRRPGDDRRAARGRWSPPSPTPPCSTGGYRRRSRRSSRGRGARRCTRAPGRHSSRVPPSSPSL